jgi:hypothetical protein
MNKTSHQKICQQTRQRDESGADSVTGRLEGAMQVHNNRVPNGQQHVTLAARVFDLFPLDDDVLAKHFHGLMRGGGARKIEEQKHRKRKHKTTKIIATPMQVGSKPQRKVKMTTTKAKY